MTYHVEYSDDTVESLHKMKRRDPVEALRIFNWIGKNLDGCEDPRRTGRALTGQFKDPWRYRVGDYRILAKIHDDRLVILLIDVKHRSTAYQD